MKKFVTKSKNTLVAAAIIGCVALSTPASAVPFIGWNQDSAFAISCGGHGAYTMTTETYYFFGVAITTRTVYRDGMNNELPGDPCEGGGGTEPPQ